MVIQGVSQAGGALAGAVVGGPTGAVVGESAGGAAGSVISDVYERFLDRMFGEEGKPITLKGESQSAALGAAVPLAFGALPKIGEAATGLSTARKVATGAFEDAQNAGTDLLGKQAEVRAMIAKKQATEDARAAVERTNSSTSRRLRVRASERVVKRRRNRRLLMPTRRQRKFRGRLIAPVQTCDRRLRKDSKISARLLLRRSGRNRFRGWLAKRPSSSRLRNHCHTKSTRRFGEGTVIVFR